MIHKLKKVLVLIWCALIILVSSGCGNSSVKVKENNLDIEKIYIFNGDNYEEVYPTDDKFTELSDGINLLLLDLPDNIDSGVDGRISLDGFDSNIAGKGECHVKVLFSTPIVVKDTRGVQYDVSMLYFEGGEIVYIFDGDYNNTLDATNAFWLKKPLFDYVKIN